ncbi:hypothetical protein ABIB75_006871 [Bradyrhizobium sp. GM2.2]
MRAILEAAVRPEKIGLTDADVEALEHGRDARPAEPMRFE